MFGRSRLSPEAEVRSVTWSAYSDEQQFGTAGTLPQVRQSEKSVFALISSNTGCRINFSWVEKLAAVMSGDIAKRHQYRPREKELVHGGVWRRCGRRRWGRATDDFKPSGSMM
jgi:hypothetical protein